MTIHRQKLHAEYVEAHEVKMDRLIPDSAPKLVLLLNDTDDRKALVTIPDSLRQQLYLGRLVIVQGTGSDRKGCIETMDRDTALVRFVD